jgi:hypothetical protein
MAYETMIDGEKGIIEVRLFGTAHHSDQLKVRDELIAVCRTRKIHKILIDARELKINNEPSTMELYEFGVTWSKLSIEMKVILAGVLPLNSKAHADIMFGNTVASNRGFITRSFDDINKAREWLRSIG